MMPFTRIIDSKLEALPYWVSLVIYVALLGVIALIALKKRWLKKSAVLLSFVLGFVVLYSGGISSFVLFFFFFALCSALSGFSKNSVEKKGKERDMSQVLANGAVPVITIFIYKLLPSFSPLLLAFASAIAEAMGDTFSSIFGAFSPTEPVSIVTRRKVKKGLSGGVTIYGFVSGLFGAFLIALLFQGTIGPSWESLVKITLFGFWGSVFDSFLGGSVQAIYLDKNGELTEKEEDDGVKYKMVRGYKWMTNDTVNLLSSLFAASLALLFSLL